MERETIKYHADGLLMQSELFYEPSERQKAGILVFPEAYGLNDYALSRAEQLATLGYAALACDLHGDALVVDELNAAVEMLDGLYAAPSRTRSRAIGGLKALASRPEVDSRRIAAIGFCFGGTMALELARSGADIKAVVGFHSGLKTVAPKADARHIKARILVCIGGDDPFIPGTERADFEAEMRGGLADWQLHVFGGTVHSFTNRAAASANRPEAVRYSPEADRRSWLLMQQLFVECLI
jgi:dienelactone hydrolase